MGNRSLLDKHEPNCKLPHGGSECSCDRPAMNPMNDMRPHERATLELRLSEFLRFLNAPGDWGYDTPMADLTLYLLNFREQLNRT